MKSSNSKTDVRNVLFVMKDLQGSWRIKFRFLNLCESRWRIRKKLTQFKSKRLLLIKMLCSNFLSRVFEWLNLFKLSMRRRLLTTKLKILNSLKKFNMWRIVMKSLKTGQNLWRTKSLNTNNKSKIWVLQLKRLSNQSNHWRKAI